MKTKIGLSAIQKNYDNNNHNLDEDEWNDGSIYDMIEHLLQDVDGTIVEAESLFRLNSNYQKSYFQD